jgi:hypothetical protein
MSLTGGLLASKPIFLGTQSPSIAEHAYPKW